MRNGAAVGLIFANMHDEAVRECTSIRSMGSLPFGGRYRLIDFVLSDMVNAGITKVGVITKTNNQSLMDHLGSGKAWDLSRKNAGLYFLPSYNSDDALYQGRLSSLAEVVPFLRRSKEEYVILSDCHMVSSMDYTSMLQVHIESGADVTVACCKGKVPRLTDIPVMQLNAEGRVTDLLIGRLSDEEATYGVGVYVVRKDWLIRVVNEATARNLQHFERDILQKHVCELNIQGYVVPELILPIYSLESYFRANLSILDEAVRQQLFPKSRPVYTKLRDCTSVRYGLHAHVTNSLVADGAKVDGTVKNCVLFRGVNIGRDAVLENCVVMQDVTMTGQCALTNVVADKNAVFREGCVLHGTESYPVYIAKNAIV